MLKKMTKFNPKNKKLVTFADALEPAMNITDKKDAQQYLKEYVDYIQEDLDKNPRSDGRTAMSIAKENIGYHAGYYDTSTMKRVHELFECTHPIFGDVVPTAKEALEHGKRRGKNQNN